MKILYLSTLIGTVAAIVVLSQGASAQDLGGPAETVHYQFSDMAADGGNLYVVYQKNIGDIAGSDVFFRKSLDGGNTFSRIVKLSDGNGHDAHVALYGNNVYVTWADGLDSAHPSKVMFVKSTDGGNTFSTPIVLSRNDGPSAPQQIIASGKNVYVLMDDALQGNTIARYSFRASHDNGATFEDPITLLQDTQTRGIAVMAASEDEKTIYVMGANSDNCPVQMVTCQYGIFLRKSTDGGLSFSGPITIKPVSSQVAYPGISASGQNVYLAWAEEVGPNEQLFLVKSNDGGSTFSKPAVVSQQDGSSVFPHLVSAGKNMYVVYLYDNEYLISLEKRHNNTSIDPLQKGFFFTKSTDGGNTFSPSTNLSGDPGTSYWSRITASGNNVFVSWGTKFGDKIDVYLKKSADEGKTFGNAANLTDEKQDYFLDDLISSGRNIYAAMGTAYPGDDLFLATSNNGGDSFALINLNHDLGIDTVLEFPFAVPVLLAGIASSVVFYRIRIRK